RTPDKSLTCPPRTKTTECSCKLWPIPGIYALTSILFESLTRAYLRKAEFGLRGAIVPTRVQTPRFCGELLCVTSFLRLLKPLLSAGALDLTFFVLRGFLINWLIVGILVYVLPSSF